MKQTTNLKYLNNSEYKKMFLQNKELYYDSKGDME